MSSAAIGLPLRAAAIWERRRQAGVFMELQGGAVGCAEQLLRAGAHTRAWKSGRCTNAQRLACEVQSAGRTFHATRGFSCFMLNVARICACAASTVSCAAWRLIWRFDLAGHKQWRSLPAAPSTARTQVQVRRAAFTKYSCLMQQRGPARVQMHTACPPVAAAANVEAPCMRQHHCAARGSTTPLPNSK